MAALSRCFSSMSFVGRGVGSKLMLKSEFYERHGPVVRVRWGLTCGARKRKGPPALLCVFYFVVHTTLHKPPHVSQWLVSLQSSRIILRFASSDYQYTVYSSRVLSSHGRRRRSAGLAPCVHFTQSDNAGSDGTCEDTPIQGPPKVCIEIVRRSEFPLAKY
jgi:hypothetical protein